MISETVSISVQDVDQAGGSVSFLKRKTCQRWIKRPASSYIRRLLLFIRATTLRLGRKPSQTLIKGGSGSSSLPWSASCSTRNSPTSDGTPGARWAPQCLSVTAPPCRSSCPGAGGNLCPSLAATSPHGTTTIGRIPICRGLSCRGQVLEYGDLRMEPARPNLSGRPLFSHAVTPRNPMDPTSPTRTWLWYRCRRYYPLAWTVQTTWLTGQRLVPLSDPPPLLPKTTPPPPRSQVTCPISPTTCQKN